MEWNVLIYLILGNSISFSEVVIAGVPHGRDVDYFIGYPFYNDTLGNITGIVPEQTEWTYIDRNISEFMQDTWLNFTKYGYDRSLTLIVLSFMKLEINGGHFHDMYLNSAHFTILCCIFLIKTHLHYHTVVMKNKILCVL